MKKKKDSDISIKELGIKIGELDYQEPEEISTIPLIPKDTQIRIPVLNRVELVGLRGKVIEMISIGKDDQKQPTMFFDFKKGEQLVVGFNYFEWTGQSEKNKKK